MTDLDAAIRAKLDQISAENDDDCNMQRGVSCASQGYGGVMAALLEVLDVHERDSRGNCVECWENGPGYEPDPVPHPCPTVQAIAEQLGIEAKT